MVVEDRQGSSDLGRLGAQLDSRCPIGASGSLAERRVNIEALHMPKGTRHGRLHGFDNALLLFGYPTISILCTPLNNISMQHLSPCSAQYHLNCSSSAQQYATATPTLFGQYPSFSSVCHRSHPRRADAHVCGDDYCAVALAARRLHYHTDCFDAGTDHKALLSELCDHVYACCSIPYAVTIFDGGTHAAIRRALALRTRLHRVCCFCLSLCVHSMSKRFSNTNDANDAQNPRHLIT